MAIVTAPLTYEGVTFHIDFESEASKDPEVQQLATRVREAEAEGQPWRHFYRQAVLYPIVSWDLIDSAGEPLSLEPEAFDELPANFDRLVMKAMTDHLRHVGRAMGARRGPKYTPPKPKRKKRR